MHRVQDAGFTLIESLVALGVLSTAAVFLLAATQSHVTRIGMIADRKTALWVAENRLVELELGVPDLPSDVEALGHLWHITTERQATSDPDLARVDIRVNPQGPHAEAASALLTGFIETRTAGGS
ncbi:type II secretion system minor pseudopilin GspI [uncultured Roseobacter sp.]|uniref:type II secretion system minor pseudopilin GspI n=1 Tax=uncultured Roseobacter sp. TaxID=114847 RepID=UPI0026126868|nr:type II secretion system minor pseudopilin GspI [uncultured Roseobacter sp.]